MDYRQAAEEVAKDMGLPKDVVLNSYKSFWRFIREHMASLPLKQGLTAEEFSQFKTCFNLPSLGKYGCPYDRYQRLRRKEQIKKDALKERSKVK